MSESSQLQNHAASESIISVVIPARNEEATLPVCLDSIFEAAKGANTTPEIVIVLNNCTDRTEEIAKKHGCKTVVENTKNLSRIRNAGVEATTSNVVITIDADSRMSRNMLGDILLTMADSDCVGGGVLMFPERISLGICMTYLLLAPIALRYRIGGGLFYFRRSAFDAISGFSPDLQSAEDIDFAIRLKRYGSKRDQYFKVLFSSWIVTSTRKFDRLGDWYFIRNFKEFRRLLKGRDPEAASRIWYDFPR